MAEIDVGILRTLSAELVRDEGEVLHAYQDTEGLWTIGVGRLIDQRRGGGITHDEALYLLGNDVRRIVAELDQHLPWWRRLSEPRQRVLLNMCFNMGVQGLLGFKNTLAEIERGNYGAAASGMLASKWAKQVGARATRLATVMREG